MLKTNKVLKKLCFCVGLIVVIGLSIPARASVWLDTAQNWAPYIPNSCEALTTGDINGDGLADVLVDAGSYAYYYLSSLGNTYDGYVTATNSGYFSALGDIDKDGYADAAVVSGSDTKIYYGSANGLVSPAGQTITGYTGHWLFLKDMDNDTDLDIVMVQYGYNIYHLVFLQAADGSFPATPSWSFSDPGKVISCALGDVNKDGRPDLITSQQYGGGWVVNLNNGSGFTRQTVASDPHVYGITIGDVNADGNADVVINEADVGELRVFYGDGSANPFSAPADQIIDLSSDWAFYGRVALPDVDRDGYPDLACVNNDSSGTAIVFLNDAGLFSYASDWASTAPGTNKVICEDMDGDTFTDLLQLDQTNNELQVFLNKVVCVTEYGAIPNDGLNDSTAIQNAINANATDGVGISFPAGVFNVSASIDLQPKAEIVGRVKPTVTWIVPTAAIDQVFLATITNPADHDVEISRLSFDGNGYPTSSLIRVFDVNDFNVNRCHFEDAGRAVFFQSGDLRPVVTDSTFNNIGTGAIVFWWSGRGGQGYFARNNMLNVYHGISVANGGTDTVIEDNDIFSTYTFAIEVMNNCDRAVIEGNDVDRYIGFPGVNYAAARDNTITNAVPATATYAIEYGYDNNVVSRNVINGAHAGLVLNTGDYSLNHDNRVENTVDGPLIDGYAVTGSTRYHVFVDNYLATSRTRGAPPYDPGRGVQIWGDGTYGYGDYWTMHGNTINDCDLEGVSLMADHFFFSNNTITNCDLAGYGLGYFRWAYGSKTEILLLTGNNNIYGPVLGIPNPEPTTTNNAPVANIAANPTSGSAPLTVSFNGTGSSDSDGIITHYLWDLDAGPAVSTSQTSYIYTKPGTYEVWLCVWDNGGRAGWTQQIITVQ